MNVTQTQLRFIRDSLISHRRQIMKQQAPIGSEVCRDFSPFTQHKLDEMSRLINSLDDELNATYEDDTWRMEQDPA